MSQLPPHPSTPTRTRTRFWLVMGCVAAVLAVVLGGVLGIVTQGEGAGDEGPAAGGTGSAEPSTTQDPEPGEPEEPESRDWLAPTRAVRVGDNRYVSPCQALTIDDVEESYGELPENTFVSEDFLDVSVADRSDLPLPFPTSCSYSDQVTLLAEQYTRRSELRRGGLATEVYSLGTEPAVVKRKLRSYRRAVAGSDDEVTRAFVADLSRAAKAFLRFRKNYDREELAGLDLDTAILPVGYKAFEFNFFQDNVAYRLVQESGGDARDLGNLPGDVVRQRLTAAAAAVERIRSNLAEPRLSQSPSPTIVGDTDTIGSTRILEPCAVLSPAVFRSITGLRMNQVARRDGLPIEATSRANGIGFSGSNSCVRTARRGGLQAGSPSSEITVEVQIDYAPSKRELNAALRSGDFRPLDRNDTRLETLAEWAAEYRVFGPNDPPYYKFILGNYFVEVSVTSESERSLGDDITLGQADRRGHVAAINTVVESLKAHLKRAER